MTNGRCVVNVHTAADNTVKNGVLTVNVTDEKNNVITNTVNFTLTNNITKVLFDGREGIIDKPMVPGTYYNVAISVLPEDTTQTDWKITALSGLDSRFSQISGPDNHTLRFMVDKNVTGETITDDAVLNLQFSAVTSVPVSITAHIVSGGYIEATGDFWSRPDAFPQVTLINKPYKDDAKHDGDSISMSYLGHTETYKGESKTRPGGSFQDITGFATGGDSTRRAATEKGTGISASFTVHGSEEEGPDYEHDEDDYIFKRDFYMYRDTAGTDDANTYFNYDFVSDGYTMRISLAYPDCVNDYQFGYPDRTTVQTREWVEKYYNGTRWNREGYDRWNQQVYNEYYSGVKTVKFVNCVIDKPIKFYAAPKSIKFINCIINCSSPVMLNVRNDNEEGYEFNRAKNVAIDYTNCTFTVSDFDDTNMRTRAFFTYVYDKQAEDYDYTQIITNMVDVNVSIKYGDVDITSAAYTALNQETSVSELPTGCTIKYGSGTTAHAIEYLRKQWGSSAVYMVKNENQETPFWIEIGDIIGTGVMLQKKTGLKYQPEIRYNINSSDFSTSSAFTSIDDTMIAKGYRIYFWADMQTTPETSSSTEGSIISFNFSYSSVSGKPFGSVINRGFKTVKIGGNIMSLYYMDDFDSKTTIDQSNRAYISYCKLDQTAVQHWVTDASAFYICPEVRYNSLFNGYYVLTAAPDMSHITSVGANQFNGMFSGCTALVNCPDLSNITIIGAKGCQSMFNGCTSLTRAILPKELTSSSQQSCATMFNGCTSLVDTTYMHISGNTGGACFYKMFMNCTALTTADIFIDANASTVATPQWEPTLNNKMSYDSATDKVTFSGTASYSGSTDYVYRYMFMNCNHLTNFLHPVNMKLTNVQDMVGMFATTKINSLTINFTGTAKCRTD